MTTRRIRSQQDPEDATRPALTPRMSLDEFRDHYWYLHELAAFCRQQGLDPSGSKLEVVARVERFLATKRREPRSRAVRARRPATRPAEAITMRTPVTADFKCDRRTRAFFRSAIGDHFHFTAHLQAYRRELQNKGARLTYGDLVREWLAERERRKDPSYQSRIARSWQYNQFVRDFMADKPRNQGKGIADAARAWNTIRVHKGRHDYAEYCRLTHGAAPVDRTAIRRRPRRPGPRKAER